MKNIISFIFSMLFMGVFCLSCIEETDFDQADDISFTPEVELNLIFFNIDADAFFDQESQTPRLILKDTTALEFLNSSDITESIRQIDFTFDFTNSIPRSFQVDFEFSRLNGQVTYVTSTAVAAGSPSEAVSTIFEETVVEADLQNLLRAEQVIVTVTIPSADASLEGALNLKSKTIYYLEY